MDHKVIVNIRDDYTNTTHIDFGDYFIKHEIRIPELTKQYNGDYKEQWLLGSMGLVITHL